MKFHHVGIIVSSINDSLKELTPFLKFEQISIPMKVISQKVNVCFLRSGEFNLEFIESIGDDSPVSKFSLKDFFYK